MQTNALGYYSLASSFCLTFPASCVQMSENLGAFGISVEDNLLDNFCIQSLEHFCLKFWRKLILKWVK
jgi:hypothetical protein